MRVPGKIIFLVFYFGCFLLIAPLSFWMLFNGQTWIGKGIGVIGLLSMLLPFLFLRWYQRRGTQKMWGWSLAFVGLVIVGFVTAVFIAAPSGTPDPDSPVQHRFANDDAKFSRFALTNVIPEVEQINLGFFLMSFVDPYLDAAQVDRVAPFTLALYHDMAQDPNFHDLGSVMGLAYIDLFGFPSDAGHYYLYVPQQAGEEPLPALIFLHGSVGNFKTYTWVLSQFAEETGFVIIAPSYGFGSWDEAGAASVLRVFADAQEVVDIDENRIFLAGLSNGGLGLSQLAETHPEMFQGLIFFSPVMNTSIVDGSSFQTAWANRPVLVITGTDDRRIPLAYVETRVDKMAAGGVDVSSVIVPDEDHFLFFSQPDRIVNEMTRWLEEIE
jgi:pimeloyl-ACP methyl ester carboxylesterase